MRLDYGGICKSFQRVHHLSHSLKEPLKDFKLRNGMDKFAI